VAQKWFSLVSNLGKIILWGFNISNIKMPCKFSENLNKLFAMIYNLLKPNA